MYKRVKTNVRTSGGDANDFLVDIGLHEGSSLNPFLFTIVWMDLLKRSEMSYHCACYSWMILSLLMKLGKELRLSWNDEGIL